MKFKATSTAKKKYICIYIRQRVEKSIIINSCVKQILTARILREKSRQQREGGKPSSKSSRVIRTKWKLKSQNQNRSSSSIGCNLHATHTSSIFLKKKADATLYCFPELVKRQLRLREQIESIQTPNHNW